MARPNKYETHVKSRFEEIKKWLQIGATEKEITENLGIHIDTWIEYKKKYSELNEFIKENRKVPVNEIKAAMLKRALGFEYSEKKVTTQQVEFNDLLSSVLEEAGFDVGKMTRPKIIKTEVTTKMALPDPTSGLILLKHWDKENEWTGDPASLKIKKEELELKKKQVDKEVW